MILLLILGLLLVALYFNLTVNFDYWKKKGVPHDTPIPLFGTNLKCFLLQVSLPDLAAEVYKKYPNEKLVGAFRGSRPEIIIRDPELANIITISDFKYFHQRGAVSVSTKEPMMKQPAFSDNDLWRQLRIRWTPAFSSGKIKAIFPTIMQKAESLQARLKYATKENNPIDAKHLMALYCSDISGSIVFGITCNSLHNNDDNMRKLGKKILEISLSRVLNQTLQNLLPEVFKSFRLFRNVEKDLTDVVHEILKHRNFEPSGRNDFLDLLLEVKKKGAMTGDSIVHANADGTPEKVSIEMDEILMTAQCTLFFAATFEPTSSVSSYTLHELAHNPDIQRKVQTEIDEVLARHNNKLSYDAINEMTYLKWCMYESMRVFPVAGPVMRKSVAPYTFPGTKVTIDAGIRIIVPTKAFHNDPNIFPEPDEFKPERFDPAVMTQLQKWAYIPFGRGQRACVGERLSMLMCMAGLAAVLSQFSVLTVPGAPRYMTINPATNAANLFSAGLPLRFEARK